MWRQSGEEAGWEDTRPLNRTQPGGAGIKEALNGGIKALMEMLRTEREKEKRERVDN